MTDSAMLGPQFPRPNLAAVLAELGIAGPLAVVTAGWQEREGEIDELKEHVGRPVLDLALYARAERVQAEDRALAGAARERQARLQELQELYRVRLAALMGALAELLRAPGHSPALRRARRAALGDVRRLDREHLAATTAEHDRFRRDWLLAERGALASERARLAAEIAGATAVLVAGGHVAVLLNRLRLFGFGELVAGKPVIAWSAGAMALSDRVVLFHDRPPQGAADAELLEGGLGLLPGVVALPHGHARLALEDRDRVREFARRFAPARCLVLEHGSEVAWRDGRVARAAQVTRLARSGDLIEVGP